HVELRAGSVANHHEDFAVSRSALPLVVGEVRGMRAFGCHRTVAFGVGAVAEAAVLLEQRLSRFDRFRRGSDGIFQLLARLAPTGVLRGNDNAEEEDESGNESRYSTHGVVFSYVRRKCANFHIPVPDTASGGQRHSGA